MKGTYICKCAANILQLNLFLLNSSIKHSAFLMVATRVFQLDTATPPAHEWFEGLWTMWPLILHYVLHWDGPRCDLPQRARINDMFIIMSRTFYELIVLRHCNNASTLCVVPQHRYHTCCWKKNHYLYSQMMSCIKLYLYCEMLEAGQMIITIRITLTYVYHLMFPLWCFVSGTAYSLTSHNIFSWSSSVSFW